MSSPQPSTTARGSAYSHNNYADGDPNVPPLYGGTYQEVLNETAELGTQASVADDGRVNVRISQKTRGLSDLLVPALQSRLDLNSSHTPRAHHRQHHDKSTRHLPSETAPPISDRLRNAPLRLNVVIQIVGSRGDVQPFVALGKVLKADYGHRVRLATHPVFKSFVEEHGLEFFSIGGDPSELMSFMVKNPGLMPGFDTLRNGDVGKRRKGIAEMIRGCWRSCIETGDGSGPSMVDKQYTEQDIQLDAAARPFIADVIIANPPSFAHIHCAEKLGIPLHMMFTMPWSPTSRFPHPLANITATNTDANYANLLSYSLVDMLTWQGLGDVINRFRQKSLGLEPISLQWAPGMLSRLRIPWTYCWSPALIPKPEDWDYFINISGFYFLSLADNYTPEPDLQRFLDSGPPPVYIGFGSIVVDDPNAMTRLIFDAVRKTGQRALVSKGWGGLGAEDLGVPDGVFMLGNVPHDWLFTKVGAVCHHGGAGTCAAGIKAGKPTIVVPFFGDQPFWGAMIYRAGAGPKPIAYKDLTSDALAEAITHCLQPEVQAKAQAMARQIDNENGTETGAKNFHDMLDIEKLRCTLSPRRAAVWRIKRTQVRLSAFAATVLIQEGLLGSDDVKLYRSQEHDVEEQPWEPITGGASAILGTGATVAMSIADFPVQTLKALRIHPDSARSRSRGSSPAPAGQVGRESGAPEASTVSHPPDTHLEVPGERSNSRSSTDGTQTPAEQHEEANDHSPNKRRSLGNHRYDVLGALGRPRSRANSGSSDGRSPSPAAGRPRSSSMAKEIVENNFDLNAMVDTTKGIYRMAGGLTKSPMDFTISVARGFHNAPKLYNDQVRPTEKITDFSSGLRAAGKEFMYGFGDGISGLVSHPVQGVRKEGAAGFFKGAAKGIAGVVLKPGAAIWGLPGYTSKGLYMEMQKRFGASVDNYIIASRTAQGLEDVANASPAERAAVIKHYKELKPYIKKKKNVGEEQLEHLRAKHEEIKQHRRSRSHAHSPSGTRTPSPSADAANTDRDGHSRRRSLANALHALKPRPPLSPGASAAQPVSEGQVPKLVVSNDTDTPKRLSRTRTDDSMLASPSDDEYTDMHPLEHLQTEPVQQLDHASLEHSVTYPAPNVKSKSLYTGPQSNPEDEDGQESGIVVQSTADDTSHPDHDFEAAIRRSLKDASRGNPDEDALVERAIRASLAELEAGQRERGLDHLEDAQMQAAIDASIRDAKAGWQDRRAEARQWADGQVEAEHQDHGDADLTLAMQESRQLYEAGLVREEAQRRDEETVIKYMISQSLAEDEIRRNNGR